MSTLKQTLEEIKARLESPFFAVKRTKASLRYQFYEPHKNNIETIRDIAPECGNHEEISLAPATDLALLVQVVEIYEEALKIYATTIGGIWEPHGWRNPVTVHVSDLEEVPVGHVVIPVGGKAARTAQAEVEALLKGRG